VDHECLTVCSIPRQKPDVSIRAAIKLSAVCHFTKYPFDQETSHARPRRGSHPDRRGSRQITTASTYWRPSSRPPDEATTVSNAKARKGRAFNSSNVLTA